MSQITQKKTCETCELHKSANPQIRVKRDILRIFSVSFYAEAGTTRTIYSHDIITL